jgi:hypothetical protein
MRAPKRQDAVRPRPSATLNVAGGLSVQFCTLSPGSDAGRALLARLPDNSVKRGTGLPYSGPSA